MLDMTAYSDFIEKNGIKSGIILADKRFPQSQAVKMLREESGPPLPESYEEEFHARQDP